MGLPFPEVDNTPEKGNLENEGSPEKKWLVKEEENKENLVSQI